MTRPWLATFPRRWHANPDLCHTVDPVGAHSGRMGVLALQLWPDCSRELLVACLCHDLGESVAGDVPASAKANNDLADCLAVIEEIALIKMGMAFDVNDLDFRRLRYLDRLDAYLWAKHHAPKLARGKKWRKARKWLKAERKEIA